MAEGQRRRERFGPLVVALALLVPVPAPAATPSFDCDRAQGPVETLLCHNGALADLDRRMSQVYADALRAFSEPQRSAQIAAQEQWLRTRDACASAPDLVRCVQTTYDLRITTLQVAAGLFRVPDPTAWDCGAAGPVTVRLYDLTQLPAAVVQVGSAPEEIAVSRPGVRGMRYQGRTLTFRILGDEAVLGRHGETDVTCTPAAAAPAGDR
ncbi:MAG: DUF1311 domain-containing protein [bacterium]|nr:DUF1311 domain-containing protein [bacterium]